jgi:glycosyltransferase involved in cell wall biosynthesis
LDALNYCLSLHRLSSVVIDGPRFPGNIHGQDTVGSANGPLVSIIVPAHNTENLVETSINSLLNQTWYNLEILAVDDASTDRTAEKLHRLAERDARLKVLSHHRNAGPYAARMTALAHARGEFITCHDSDDWAHPQRIERQAQPLVRHRRLVATVSDWVRMTDAGEFYVRKSWPLIHHNPASVMFRRREVLDRMGGFDLVRAGADSEFYERLKVVFGATAARRTKGILAVGSHRPGSLMNDPEIGVTNHVLSPSRLAYWEAWRQWHVQSLRAGQKPYMSAVGPRPFEAPAELLIA